MVQHISLKSKRKIQFWEIHPNRDLTNERVRLLLFVKSWNFTKSRDGINKNVWHLFTKSWDSLNRASLNRDLGVLLKSHSNLVYTWYWYILSKFVNFVWRKFILYYLYFQDTCLRSIWKNQRTVAFLHRQCSLVGISYVFS